MLIRNTGLRNKMHKKVEIEDISFIAPIGTGSEVNVMTHDQLIYLNGLQIDDGSIPLQGLDSKMARTLEKMQAKMSIDGEKIVTAVYIVPNNYIPMQLIIGREYLHDAASKLKLMAYKLKNVGKKKKKLFNHDQHKQRR